MEERQARELGEALAFLIGDERDEPLRCGWCGSSADLARMIHRDDVLECTDCGHMTTMHVASEQRTERLRARVKRGVGGPLLDAFPKGL